MDNEILEQMTEDMKQEIQILYDYVLEDLNIGDSNSEDIRLIDLIEEKLYSINLKDVIDAVVERCMTFIKSYKEF